MTRGLGATILLALLGASSPARADECVPGVDLAHQCFCRIGIQPVHGIAVGQIFERGLDFFLHVDRVIEPHTTLESAFRPGDDLPLFQVPSFSTNESFLAINTSGYPSTYDVLVRVPPDGSITQLRGLNTAVDSRCSVEFDIWRLAEILTSDVDSDGTCIEQVRSSASFPRASSCDDYGCSQADPSPPVLAFGVIAGILFAMRRQGVRS